MNKVRSVSSIQMNVILELTEAEANALYEITSYGHKPFTEWFYRNLGRSYLQKHEAGLISLFETIRSELPKHLKKVKDSRLVFTGAKVAIDPLIKTTENAK